MGEELDWTGAKAFLGTRLTEDVSKERLLFEVKNNPIGIVWVGGDYSEGLQGVKWKGMYHAVQVPGNWTSNGLSDLGIRLALSSYTGETAFSTGHFKNDNPVGWYRYGILTTENGKRYLYIDEIQSDWQQNFGKATKNDPDKKPKVDLRASSYKAVQIENERGNDVLANSSVLLGPLGDICCKYPVGPCR